MTYYASCYGPRYGDTTATFVALKPGLTEELCERAIVNENEEYLSCTDDDQPLDLCIWGESAFSSAKGLFDAVELREARADLRAGKAVVLYHGAEFYK